MDIVLDPDGTPEGLQRCIQELLDKGAKGVLALACDANGFTPEGLDPVLKGFSAPVFGGIFPEVIMGDERYRRGTVLAGLPVKPEVCIIPALSEPEADLTGAIENCSFSPSADATMFVFVDGFASRIGALIDSLFNLYGLEVNYVGGGAGSLELKMKPCLFTNNGLVQDSALLAMVPLESGIGVDHGWKPVGPSHRVTGSDGNRVTGLDWQPAFEVYAREIEKHSGEIVTEKNFFNIARRYPFGISKMDAPDIVRDPFMPGPDGSLICVGEVPEGSYLRVLSGDADSVVRAAEEAARMAEQAYAGDNGARTAVFFDCISRVLFLGDNFSRELAAVSVTDLPLLGALSIGEIANNGKTYLEFYNKTAVLCILEG